MKPTIRALGLSGVLLAVVFLGIAPSAEASSCVTAAISCRFSCNAGSPINLRVTGAVGSWGKAVCGNREVICTVTGLTSTSCSNYGWPSYSDSNGGCFPGTYASLVSCSG